MEKLTLGALRRAVFEGDVANGSVMMGQIAGMCKEIKPMQEILDEMMHEAFQNKELLQQKFEELK